MPTTPTATLRETVGQQLADISPTVEAKVVDAFVEKEVNRRADAIVNGMDQLQSVERELAKIDRPDVTTFNADKSVASETYSKGRLDEIEKVTKRRDKLTAALDKALSGDMGDLYNLTGGKGGKHTVVLQDNQPEAE